MPAVNHLLQQFAEHLQFARRICRIHVVQFQQPQIAAHLAQPQQRGQHHHATLGDALRAHGGQHFLAARFDDLLINAALIGRQFAERHLFELRGQIGRHFLLEPPQHERAQSPGEPGSGLRRFFSFAMGNS